MAGSDEKRHLPKTVQIVEMARKTALAMKKESFLVLDACFSVGPVFLAAAAKLNGVSNFVHILTRAKKNVVAYGKPPKKDPHKRGPAKKYGKKMKLMNIFDSTAKCYRFQTIEADIYGQTETVHYLVLDLLWKPVKGMLRFILVETSRKPKKNKNLEQNSTDIDKTNNTLAAIEKFVNVQLLVLGMLQLIATQFSTEVKAKANCWLRTVSSKTPSEFVTRTALSNILRNNLYGFGKDWITQLIQNKQKERRHNGSDKKVA